MYYNVAYNFIAHFMRAKYDYLFINSSCKTVFRSYLFTSIRLLFFLRELVYGVSKTVLSFLTVTASVIFVAEISRIWLFIDVTYYIVLRDVATLI